MIRTLRLGAILTAVMASACSDSTDAASLDAGAGSTDGGVADAGSDFLADAGGGAMDGASMDASAAAAECIARGAECDRSGVDYTFQCGIEARRTCIVGAATCGELVSCYLGPSPPPDGGWSDAALAELSCERACSACEPPATPCTAACAAVTQRDCIRSAATCAAVDACS